MIELFILEAAADTHNLIPPGILDAIIGLCALGVSSLFGFSFAMQRRMTKLETYMEDSQKDRDDIWAQINANRNKCDIHLIERTEVKTILQYMKQAVDEMRADLKEMKNGKGK